MLKFIKKIIFFLSLFLFYFIFKEFLQLYTSLKSFHPYAAYVFLFVFAGIFLYFVVIPIIKIFKIPRNPGPTTDKTKENLLIAKRMELFKKNKYLQSIHFDFSELESTKENYDKIVKILEKEAAKIRKKHVSQLFYSTSIAQNGFLDAVLILSASINHIKEIFLLYNGRVSNRDLITIAKKIYYSVAIGGSEGIEYASQEIFSKFATQGMKSIPFIDKILASIADGFVNAALLTRISYITENYCKLTHIKSERDIYPNPQFVFNSAKNITADMMERIYGAIKKMALERTLNFALVAINPIGYVWSRSIEKSENINPLKKEKMMEQAKLIGNPLAYALEKLIKSLRKH
jgi:hypothetical protein